VRCSAVARISSMHTDSLRSRVSAGCAHIPFPQHGGGICVVVRVSEHISAGSPIAFHFGSAARHTGPASWGAARSAALHVIFFFIIRVVAPMAMQPGWVHGPFSLRATPLLCASTLLAPPFNSSRCRRCSSVFLGPTELAVHNTRDLRPPTTPNPADHNDPLQHTDAAQQLVLAPMSRPSKMRPHTPPTPVRKALSLQNPICQESVSLTPLPKIATKMNTASHTSPALRFN
jgi:hypothetical protein